MYLILIGTEVARYPSG